MRVVQASSPPFLYLLLLSMALPCRAEEDSSGCGSGHCTQSEPLDIYMILGIVLLSLLALATVGRLLWNYVDSCSMTSEAVNEGGKKGPVIRIERGAETEMGCAVGA